MTATTHEGGGGSLVSFLASQLRPRAGRLQAVLQIAFCCAVVTAIDMAFQLPLAGTSVYLVFLVTRSDSLGTVQTAVATAAAATLAIALLLVCYLLDASEPALRLPLMALGAFVGMYTARILVLGPASFLVGYALVYGQTLIDRVPDMEALTRLVLWLWVVLMVPASVTVLVNLALAPDARTLAGDKAHRLLLLLADSLRTGRTESLETERAEAVELLELRQRAAVLDERLKGLSALDARLIEEITEVVLLQRLLPADTPVEVRLRLAGAVERSAGVLAGKAPVTEPPLSSVLSATLTEPAVLAMVRALDRVGVGLEHRRRGVAKLPAVPSARSLFVPGAFSDPAHVRFALKATLAAMAAYAIYSGLAWPGMSTALTTVIFVSLGSLGESVHKLTLRIVGALLGGLLAILTLVFVLPHVTDIGGLCVVVAIGAAIGAWVGTSDQRLAYAGLQIAYAFFLGVLQGYEESTELTVIKDRIFGILLGNVLVTLVFASIWPVTVTQRARSAVAGALQALAELLRTNPGDRPGARMNVIRALGEGRRLLSLARFELTEERTRAAGDLAGREEQLERLAAAVLVVSEQRGGERGDERRDPRGDDDDELAAVWLQASSSRLTAGQGFAPVPLLSTEASAARALLHAEMEVTRASST